MAEARGDVVWFGGTESCAVPPAITSLTEAVHRDGGIAVAAPGEPAPHAAAPADQLGRLWKKPRSAHGLDPVPDLVRRRSWALVPSSWPTSLRTPWCGVPARVLRKRFDDDDVARLLRVAWWDWPQAVVEGTHRWFTRPWPSSSTTSTLGRWPATPPDEGLVSRETGNADSRGPEP